MMKLYFYLIGLILVFGCSSLMAQTPDAPTKLQAPEAVEAKPTQSETVADSATPAQKPAKYKHFDRRTPEGTFRVFMMGVMLSHPKLLELTMVPVSEEDMQVLLKKNGEAPDKETAMKAIVQMELRQMKLGETFRIPGGETVITLDEKHVADDAMMIMPAGSPLPTQLYKEKGNWWVDASQVIAMRKTAELIRARNEASQQEAAKEAESEN